MGLPSKKWNILSTIGVFTFYMNNLINFIGLKCQHRQRALNVLFSAKSTFIIRLAKLVQYGSKLSFR